MRGEVHILVNCPIDTFLKEKQHSAMVQPLEYIPATSRPALPAIAF